MSFSELRKYDSELNGWIDENDKIFSKLLIWSMEPNRIGTLYTLKEKDVGALFLESVESKFYHKDSENNLIGETTEMGIFLSENLKPGSIQQIDFYTKH